MSIVDYVIGSGVYMLPSNLNLRIGSKVGYNNKILAAPAGAMIGVNGVLNKQSTAVTKPSTVTAVKPSTNVTAMTKPSTTVAVTTNKPTATVSAYTSTEEEEIVAVGLVVAIGGGLYCYYSRR